ncbi:MAG TPA: tetratricopeptide repeat protein [Rhizomicrobium sp.]|jgi:tetratricopeptide (TPR) repeat protein
MSKNVLLLICLLAFSALAAQAAPTTQEEAAVCVSGKPAKETIAGCTKILSLPTLDSQAHVGALLVRGDAYSLLGDLDIAAADYESAQKISYSPNVSVVLGQIYVNLGKSNQAIAEFTKIVDAGLATAQIFNLRGGAFQNAGDFDASIADFNKALLLKPDFLMAINNRAAAYAKKGDLKAALKDIDAVLAADPNMPMALANRCGLLAKDGNLELGRQSCDKAERLASDNYFILLAIGGAYYDASRFAEAVDYFSRSIRLMPQNPRALYMRGMAEAKLGKAEDSNADIMAAAQIQPDIAVFMTKSGLK